jgi:hypothetical protein
VVSLAQGEKILDIVLTNDKDRALKALVLSREVVIGVAGREDSLKW